MTKDQFMHTFNHALFIRMNSIYGVGKPCTIPMSNDYYKVCHDTLEFVRRQYMLEETKNIDNAELLKMQLEYVKNIPIIFKDKTIPYGVESVNGSVGYNLKVDNKDEVVNPEDELSTDTKVVSVSVGRGLTYEQYI